MTEPQRLTLLAFSIHMGLAITLPALAPLIRTLGLTEFQGGLLFAAGAAATLVAGPLWGKRGDRAGIGRIIVCGVVGLGIAQTALAASIGMGLAGLVAGGTLLGLIVIGRVLVGLAAPAATAGFQAAMALCSTEENRNRAMGLLAGAQGAALVAGPALGGLLLHGGLFWPFILASLLPFTVLGLAMSLPRHNASREAQEASADRPTGTIARRWHIVALTTLVNIVTLQYAAGFFVQDRFALAPGEAGTTLAMAFTLAGLGLLLAQGLSPKLHSLSSIGMVRLGLGLLIMGQGLLLASGTIEGFVATHLLLGVGIGLAMPGVNAAASRETSAAQQGRLAGEIAALGALASIPAPPMMSLAYRQDIHLPFLLCAAGSMLCLLFSGYRQRA